MKFKDFRKLPFAQCKLKSSIFIVLSSIIIILCVLHLVLTMSRYKYHFKNKKKLIYLLICTLALSFSYIVHEMIEISYFSLVETFLRDILFTVCFYFFFKDLIAFKISFWIFPCLMILLSLITLLSGF